MTIQPETQLPVQPGTQVQDPIVTPRYFTEDEVNRIRQQEKDKLYERLTKQQEQLDTFNSTIAELKSAEDARKAEVTRQQQAAEEARRRADEEKMSAQELIAAREAEFARQLEQQRLEMDNKIALWQKEQEFLNQKAYIQRRVSEEVMAGTIIPDLAEYITGETEAEVEAAIEKAKVKTDSIVKGAQTLTAPVPPGVSSTGSPGLMNLPSGPRQYSRDDIANMSMSEYAAYRKQQGIDRRGNGQGLFS